MPAVTSIRARQRVRRLPAIALIGLATTVAFGARAEAQSPGEAPSRPSDPTVSSPDSVTSGGLRGLTDAGTNDRAGQAALDGTAGFNAPPANSATPPDVSSRDTPGPVAAVPALSGTQSPDNRAALGRINLRTRPIDARPALPPAAPLDQGPGIRLGTFILRPELAQSLGAEHQTYADGTHSNRTYSQTRIRGTLSSDWARHALTITGSGTYQKNISGTGDTQPAADIEADLRLDLAEQTTAELTAGYDFYRESISDPNAVAGATSQSIVNTFTGGAELSRNLGKLRGSVAAKAIRTSYGDVDLADGSTQSQSDRNTLAGEFTTRVGYQLSGALTPFVQARYRRTHYDHGADTGGYRRSSDTYTAQLGLTADLDEKLSGEIAAGYVLRRYEDARLPDVDGAAIDATGHWSPHRGTDIALTLSSQLEEATTPGVSGPIAYAVGATLTQQMRDDVVARLGAQYLYRDYQQNGIVPDEQVYTLSTGLSWYLNRYLSLDGNAAFSRTTSKDSHDQDVATVDVGLTVRR